jgi:nucleoside 2-deoxyribosyltransferase
MQRKLQLFVSSTYNDLLTERQAAVEAILRAGHIPAGMELFAAGDKSQWETICRWIDESDIYMLILGGRYGSVDPDTGKSYTQLEYEYALATRKPLFAIVLSDKALDRKVRAHGRAVTELKRPSELAAFRTLVTSKVCRFANDGNEIKIAIHEAIQELTRQYQFAGWLSGRYLAAIDESSRFVEHAQAWVGRDLIDDLLCREETLNIFLKDGRTFFREKRTLLEQRFSTVRARTDILLLHPDYAHMAAVAAMDPNKNSRKQREDCVAAIKAMHDIRANLPDSDRLDDRVGFWGYHLVPTWNGFMGEHDAIIHLYFSRPYRGELNTLILKGSDPSRKPSGLFTAYRTEFVEILRELRPESNLWTLRIP